MDEIRRDELHADHQSAVKDSKFWQTLRLDVVCDLFSRVIEMQTLQMVLFLEESDERSVPCQACF